MSPIALGLMSGTSADGVSAAIASFKDRSFRLLAYKTFSYPKKIREKILRSVDLKTPEISSLDFELGRIFSEAALKIIRASGIPRKKIKVIGSHGQTVYHGPKDKIPSTFQIGEAGVIAERTGISVVSDFRPQDVAIGGQGAPLIPFFDFYFYGQGPVTALQNIGGIANVTIVGREIKNPVAFDSGPGNILMDLAIRKITKGRLSHDPSGKWAAQGKIEMKCVQSMTGYPYFGKRPPKSTGPEEFGEKFLKRYAGNLKGRPQDVLATLNFFTAFTIYKGIADFMPRIPQEIIVSGGGALNLTLMANLKKLFYPLPVHSIAEFGIPVQAKEPIAFAFFALRAVNGQINHLPKVTGAHHSLILGKITHATD